jgi:hypothetical protein
VKKISLISALLLMLVFSFMFSGCSEQQIICDCEEDEVEYEEIYLDCENANNYLSINTYCSDGIAVFSYTDVDGFNYYNYSYVCHITTSANCEYKFITCLVFFTIEYPMYYGLDDPPENPIISTAIDINGNSHCSFSITSFDTLVPYYSYSVITDFSAIIIGYALVPYNSDNV